MSVPTVSHSWPKDQVPKSVHGLMTAFGGFEAASSVTDSGCEKRLELDIATNKPDGILAADLCEWHRALKVMDEKVRWTQQGEHLLSLITDRAVLVVSRDRIVVTTAANLLPHLMLDPLLHLIEQHECTVDWVSFMRKNNASPWASDNAMNHVMASEYAELKQRFPRGKSFLLGPVDGDHYFCFMHDNVDRRGGSAKEDDVQVNLVMYGVKSCPTRHREGVITQHCHTLPSNRPDEYETLRFFEVPGSGSCVTFETNFSGGSYKERIDALLSEYQPQRFTLISLFDPQSETAKRWSKGDKCGLDFFDGFSVENRCTNEFSPGYVMRKSMFLARTQ